MEDELYERIAFYREKFYEREDIEEVVREYLLHSTMSIKEVSNVFYFLNLPDNKQPYECEFRKNEEELFKVLEVI